jgi:ABC-type dipeptide/oligopeptide/nickel transport system permease subunit
LGVVLISALALVVMLGPWLSPQSPTELQTAPFQPPGDGHLLGTDVLGRDVLARVLHGGTSVVMLGLTATVLGMIIGTALGLFAGWRRGTVGGVVMWLNDVLLAFPALLLLLLLVAALGPGSVSVVVAVTIFHIPIVTRIVRAATLEVVGRGFIEAARLRRERPAFVLAREVLPNISRTVLADAGTRLTLSIIVIAGANYLGLGLGPPAADWGLMVSENRPGLQSQPWATLTPGLAIALVTIAVNLLADSFGGSQTAGLAVEPASLVRTDG